MEKLKCNATGKVVFETKGEATATMISFKESLSMLRYNGSQKRRRKHKQGKPKQKRAYFCEHCLGWHLTSWETPDKIK